MAVYKSCFKQYYVWPGKWIKLYYVKLKDVVVRCHMTFVIAKSAVLYGHVRSCAITSLSGCPSDDNTVRARTYWKLDSAFVRPCLGPT